MSLLNSKAELFRYQEKKFAGTKYQKSKKICLAKEIQKCIERQVDQQNLRLSMKLFQSCNPKTYRKNYKGDVVKKV